MTSWDIVCALFWLAMALIPLAVSLVLLWALLDD